jgi:hypothetical protein
MLARHIRNLDDYESDVKKHRMAAPILVKMRKALVDLADKDVANLLSFLAAPYWSKRNFLIRTIKYPSLLQKLKLVVHMYRALRISRTYGW